MNYIEFFEELSKIPRGSGNTKAVSDYLVEFAKERNLEHYQDEYNNVVIIKEATKGRENDDPVIIQGHMDIVAVHDEDYDIDMTCEGLTLCREGDFLFAKGTSLGADDGIAVAYGLALLDSDELSLPRLELVVTVDEEIGMLGATQLDLSMCKAHKMLNIDSEEEGFFLVSCAGGTRIDVFFPMEELAEQEVEGTKAYTINISGLVGGHSGTEINKGRANAIVLMNKIISKLNDSHLVEGIREIKGGTADNAIPAECKAEILCKTIEPELFDIIKFEALENFMGVEKNASITLTEAEASDKKWYSLKDSGYCSFVTGLPNGVMAMSKNIEDLVETSLNHGLISFENGEVEIGISIRSSIDEKKEELVYAITDKGFSYGAHFNVHGDYPGWAYREDSPLRDRMVSIYEEMYGEKPVIMALHAGLECGVLAKKIDDLDCVSFGPWIYDIHTTREKLSISSADRVWNFIVKVLS